MRIPITENTVADFFDCLAKFKTANGKTNKGGIKLNATIYSLMDNSGIVLLNNKN